MNAKVVILSPMRTQDWKKKLQTAAKEAQKAPYINNQGLAELAGWNHQASFAKFCKECVGGEDKLAQLEVALKNLGFLAVISHDNIEHPETDDVILHTVQELNYIRETLLDGSKERRPRLSYAAAGLTRLADKVQRLAEES